LSSSRRTADSKLFLKASDHAPRLPSTDEASVNTAAGSMLVRATSAAASDTACSATSALKVADPTDTWSWRILSIHPLKDGRRRSTATTTDTGHARCPASDTTNSCHAMGACCHGVTP